MPASPRRTRRNPTHPADLPPASTTRAPYHRELPSHVSVGRLRGRLSAFGLAHPARGCLRLGLALGICVWVGLASLPAAELRPAALQIGFTQSCFLGLNRNDAEASFKVFLASVGRQHGYAVQSRVAIFDAIEPFEAAIARQELDLAILDAWHFVTSRQQDLLEPAYVTAPKDAAGRTYTVLTRKDSGLKQLADLRGKEFLLLEMGAATMGVHWLQTQLLSQGLGSPDTFFGRVESVGKPASAVLPVFFGKKNACLVDRLGFDVMTEMNPQVGDALQAILTSENTVDSVICLRKGGWKDPQLRDDTFRALGDLHGEPGGQQILTLFKVAKLVAFREDCLESVRKLRATHDRLQPASQP